MRRFFLAVVSFLVAGVCFWQLHYQITPSVRDQNTLPAVEQPNISKHADVVLAQTRSISDNLQFPKLTGRVIDNASLLSSGQKSTLENKLAQFEAKSSDQIVVATLLSLSGSNLEDYANQLFREWQLGQAGENNGVLLLVAKNDRKIRIEVGYGLEGILTDALSRMIIDQTIVPKFKTGDFGNGIVEGTDMIIRVLSGDISELEARNQRSVNNKNDDTDLEFWIFMAIWGILFFGPFAFALLAPIFGKKIGKKRYRWLGLEMDYFPNSSGSSKSGRGDGNWSGGVSGGGFSGGGGSSGGGGASGGW